MEKIDGLDALVFKNFREGPNRNVDSPLALHAEGIEENGDGKFVTANLFRFLNAANVSREDMELLPWSEYEGKVSDGEYGEDQLVLKVEDGRRVYRAVDEMESNAQMMAVRNGNY